jgi:hypothetical protein
MPKYKVISVEQVRSKGEYEANSPEEAIEMFRLDHLKLDYTKSPLDYLTSGWNPEAEEIDA